eukprot:TRINITY_DN2517_c0_g1_i1.p1 TRINITY_DN2517_c0_g1~~TRINITY_DN2517_c0_g1_i1.p1  ORF type:complete len:257 (-),score=45.03 TRINITY_DN2517_c0_g1_i1:322-1092(-)
MASLPSPLLGQHVLTVKQFSLPLLQHIFHLAQVIKDGVKKHQLHEAIQVLRGRVLSSMFFEQSTRTSSSFSAAMGRLGGHVVPFNEITSSVVKGESFRDTVITLACYADVIVIRHSKVGSALEASKSSLGKPVINAGDGIGEHPTQALLDLFTIQEKFGKIDGLTITLLGDLKNGRTVHSLVHLLSQFENLNINLVSPSTLSMPKEITEELEEKKKIRCQTHGQYFQFIGREFGEGNRRLVCYSYTKGEICHTRRV